MKMSVFAQKLYGEVIKEYKTIKQKVIVKFVILPLFIISNLIFFSIIGWLNSSFSNIDNLDKFIVNSFTTFSANKLYLIILSPFLVAILLRALSFKLKNDILIHESNRLIKSIPYALIFFGSILASIGLIPVFYLLAHGTLDWQFLFFVKFSIYIVVMFFSLACFFDYAINQFDSLNIEMKND